MRIMVDSFKRLYQKGILTKQQMRDRVENGRISREEYVYITGELYDDKGSTS